MDSMSNEEIRKLLALDAIKTHKWTIVDCSAITGRNLQDGINFFGNTMATNDGSEDVNDFLLRIRELGDQRDREDEERTRKLEEEILQGRKERQARRA
ncbi:MAG: hypothetical protein Q9184_005098, partial [Pyrenodesmia sp. 2 TL-2023]